MNLAKVLISLLFVISCFSCFGSSETKIDSSTQTKNYNKFLKYIFNKYGSKGVISFEGLEHLMHSLGLGGLEFNPKHTIYEHRPEGFQVPDISAIENDELSTLSGDSDGDNNKVTVNINSDKTELDNLNYSTDDKNKENDNKLVTDAIQRNNMNDESDEDKWRNNVWQEIIFKELHDSKHRHPRHHDQSSNSCLSPMHIVHLTLDEPIKAGKLESDFNYEISPHSHSEEGEHVEHHHKPKRETLNIETFNELEDHEDVRVSRIKITPSSFLELCPALLVQIDQGACLERQVMEEELSKHAHHHHEKQLFSYAWLYATVCVFIISICGLTGVAIVPLAKSVAYDEILRFLVALAVGTLCGDALMHLLPHALTPHLDHGDDNLQADTANGNLNDEPVWLCCCAFMSALFMYSLESLLPLLRGEDAHHGHSHALPTFHNNDRRNTNVPEDIEMDLEDVKKKELNVMLKEQKKDDKVPLSPIAFMVILGDGLHNITDGLAIGAAFATDPVTGMATSLAILCHELPHELGDFALLLQTGVSIKKAMLLNIFSSILSFIGMIIGLIVAGMHTSLVRWIYAGTAGTFLYIALADLIPEMSRNLRESNNRTLKAIFSQLFGIFMGGLIMLTIALNEDRLRILFE